MKRFGLQLAPYRPALPEVAFLGGVRQIKEPGKDIDLGTMAAILGDSQGKRWT